MVSLALVVVIVVNRSDPLEAHLDMGLAHPLDLPRGLPWNICCGGEPPGPCGDRRSVPQEPDGSATRVICLLIASAGERHCQLLA